MPKKKAAGLTHPRLPGKTYKTERGLKQALDMLDRKEARETELHEPSSVEFASEPVNIEQPSALPEFIRNTTYTQLSLRLERHETKRRIELKPRGQRGDIAPIQPADLHDPILVANLEIGIIELLTADVAAEVAGKQTTNQQAVHPALAMLRNELGEEYAEGAFKVEKNWEDQGITVAELEDGNIVVDRGGIRRKRGQEPGTPDYIAGAERHHAPAGEEAAFLSDLRARAKNLEGPAAGLGGIQRVVVTETEQS